MSRNGELCLKKLILTYSPSMGNPAMRQFLATYLPAFHAQYPQVIIDLRPRFWPESSITGVYRDGSERAYSVRYMSSMGINIRVHKLVNEGNDTSVPFSAQHVHFQRRSVQGTWNPWLWNYEAGRTRSAPPAHWARKLNAKEWDYYIGQYSAQLQAEEEAIAQRVARHSEMAERNAAEVQQRWTQYVAPRLQSDLEYNLEHWKRQHARGGAAPAGATLHEYSLFSVPDHNVMGQDAIDMLRRREAHYVEEWWRQRQDQLKPPA